MRLAVIPSIEPAVHPLVGAEAGPASIAAVKVLRISVTDRCNFRCVYCMPADGVQWLPKANVLSFEEIAEIVRAAVDVHGVRRFKLTGGEPTVRQDLPRLIEMLRAIDGVTDLSLTTNGALLAPLARPMRDAGLDRITVSIDSLNPSRFKQVTRTGNLATVLDGLDVAAAVGFDGLKVNCVAMRGVNDDEFADFARLTVDRKLTVRFIEYMPLGDAAVLEDVGPVDASEMGPAGGCGAQSRGDVFVSEGDIRSSIESELGTLLPVDRVTEPGVGPANVYTLPGRVAGRVGFISAMSAPFCATCNRLRLTATGLLRSCLFEGGEIDTQPILREPMPVGIRSRRLAAAMEACVKLKPVVHGGRGNEQMSRIGG